MFSRYSHSLKKVLITKHASFCDQLWPSCAVSQKRDYLPVSFQCESAWNQRLSEDLVKKIGKPGEFYLKMLQKMKTEMKMWPLDLDLYMHSLATEGGDWHPHEILEILKKYRRAGGVTVEVLESTQHAALRLLLEGGHTHKLLSVLCQPERCGVFLDHFTAPLAMDHYLQKQDYASSSVVATRLMLIERLDMTLTSHYALLSSLLYLLNCRDSPHIDFSYAPAEPPEKVLLRIDNYRKSQIDEDLGTSDHVRLVGKTLVICAQQLPAWELRENCSVLGWAASQDWAALQAGLGRLAAAGGIAASVKEETERLVSAAAEEDLKMELLATVSRLPPAPQSDVVSAVEEQLRQCIEDAHPKFVTDLESLYKTWADERNDLFRTQCEAYERQHLMRSIKEKKKELKTTEQQLYFFDREVEMDVLKAGRVIRNPFPREKPKQFRYKEKATKEGHDKYIPPSMVGGRLIKLPSD